jgi:WD40 repeat protein
MTTSFNFSKIPVNQVEIDALACYALESDGMGEFHVVCSTKSMELASFFTRGTETGIDIEFSWKVAMKSRAWHVVASIPGEPNDPAFFVARDDGHFHAYGIKGRPCWSHDFSGIISEFRCYGDPFTGERTLVIPSIDKTLRMLTANAGRLVWGDTFGSGVNIVDQCLQADGETHVIAAGGNDYTLRCYARNVTEYASAYKMVWFHKFESYVRDVSFSPHGKIAAVADDGFVKVFDISDGSVLWQREHGSFAWKCRILDGETPKVVSSSFQVPLAVDESGDKLGNPGVVACHELSTGSLIWQTNTEDGINVNAWDFHEVDGRWLLAAGTTDGDVVLLDAETGEVLQRYRAGQLINDVHFFELKNGQLAIIGCQESEDESLFAGMQEL